MKDVYLDNSATTFPKPPCVFESLRELMLISGGSPGRGAYRKAVQAEAVQQATRFSAARLFGAGDPSRIIFTSNATESLNLAIKGVLLPGDHAVITDLEHNAVLGPLWWLAQTEGVDFTVVETSREGLLDPREIRRAVNDRTRLICCVHADNVLGTIQPIAEVGEIARKRGIPFLVDASQSAGVIPIDVRPMNIDLLAFTGHKGLLGPQGIGGLYVREGIEPRPLKHGGTRLSCESEIRPAEIPGEYEPGAPNMLGIAGLGAAIDFVTAEGVDKIGAHQQYLNRELMTSLEGVKGVTLYGPRDPHGKVGLTSMNIEGLDAADVGRLLDRRFGIMVRTGHHCSTLTHRKLHTEAKGAVRLSFGFFNTRDDVVSAVQAIQRLAATTYEAAHESTVH